MTQEPTGHSRKVLIWTLYENYNDQETPLAFNGYKTCAATVLYYNLVAEILAISWTQSVLLNQPNNIHQTTLQSMIALK